MEPPVVNKPKVNITPKITKISSLAQSAEEIKKTSTKLRKTFESGSYQKKTQLSVLNRYKKRLDSIQKQNDKRFLKKQKVKIKLPEIKKFAGSFFSAGSDPLKSIGALAAFNALSKGAKGDLGGAVGPALVAAGIFFGPALLKGGATLLKKPSSTTTTPQIGVAGASAGSFWGTPYSQTAAGKSYAGMQQSRNLPKWAQKMSSSSASRFAASNERIIQGTANIGDRLRVGTRGMGMQGVGGVAENVATSKPSISPRFGLLNAALFGLDFLGRKSEGQTNLQAGVGAGAGVGGALIGAAIGTMLFPGVGTYAGWLIGAAFSTGGAMIASAIADKITGAGKPEQDRLKKQTEEQKKLVEKKQDKTLTFGKSLDRYERVVNKFDQFSKTFTGGMGLTPEQVRQTATRIENLGGGSTPISAAGYEFTQQGSFSQYLTGDVNAPEGAYDPSHGTSDNYHDHFAFKDPDTAKRAYEFLKSKGITVTEFGSGVTGPHSGAGSAHHRGLAFDVPGYQWGGSGAIGPKEYAGSAKVRAFMNDFYNSQTGQPGQSQLKKQLRRQTLFDLTRAAATGLRDKGPVPFQYNGQTYYLLVDESFNSSIYKHRDALGLTREYYDFIGNRNLGLHNAAIKKVNSMFSNAYTTLYVRAPEPPTVTAPPPSSRSISQYTSYDPRGQIDQVIPVAIPIQQQMMQAGGTESMMLPGPSEQDLLNSFYKRVLLNTVA